MQNSQRNRFRTRNNNSRVIKNNNRNRIVRYPRRYNNIQRTLRYNYNNRASRNNNRRDYNLSNKINRLTDKISQLNVKNDRIVNDIKKENKSKKNNNYFKTNKEMRRDKLIPANEMMRYGNPLSFYKTPLNIVHVKIYNKYNISVPTSASAANTFIMWFPYGYPYIGIRRTKGYNIYSNLYTFDNESGNDKIPTNLVPLASQIVNMPGQVRLLAATLKINNVTPMLQKAGTYTIFRNPINDGYPTSFDTNDYPLSTTDGDLYNGIRNNVVNRFTLQEKLTLTCNESAVANEYNVYQGNTVFQDYDEYLGNEYSALNLINQEKALPIFNFNPQGVNNKYLIDIPGQSAAQDYNVETWQIFEVSPSNEGGFGSLGDVCRTVNRNITMQAKKYFPIHKI